MSTAARFDFWDANRMWPCIFVTKLALPGADSLWVSGSSHWGARSGCSIADISGVSDI